MSELLKRPETMVDVYRLLPEGTPIQVINNEFYMSPAPNVPHFRIVDTLTDRLRKIVKDNDLGEVFFAPVDVFLGNKNAVQPDIFFVSNNAVSIVSDEGIYGAPDLIIEVLSPGNQNADLIKKKSVYEEFGVKEYFIVDPADKAVITYYFQNNAFIAQPSQKGKLSSKLLQAEIEF